jgi:hypothetical protein
VLVAVVDLFAAVFRVAGERQRVVAGGRWMSGPWLWHAADLTVLEHVVRDDAPGSGRCGQCQPDGSCGLLSWAVRFRAGEDVPYPQGPVAPLDLRAA